jgi:hypothetical protein
LVSPVENSISKDKSSGQEPSQANLVGTCKLIAGTGKPAIGTEFDKWTALILVKETTR